MDALSLDESLPVADLCAEDALNELARFLDFRHGQRKINLFTLPSPDDHASRPQHRRVLGKVRGLNDGTVAELRAGIRRPMRREDFISRRIYLRPDADMPTPVFL